MGEGQKCPKICPHGLWMTPKAVLDQFHEFDSKNIWDMVDVIYVIKVLLYN